MRQLLLAIIIVIAVPTQAQDKRPNIIYIMADDMGYADLSGYGRKDYQTPNFDKLASQGVKFMQAYAASAVCTPTRTSFITGRYPTRTPVGLMEPLRGTARDKMIGLTPVYTSLPTILKKSGYATYLVGKWHLGSEAEHTPNRNGYDYFFGFNQGATDYITHTNMRGEPDLFENEKPITRPGYSTDIWMQKATEIIRQQHTKPFFMSIMFNAPHWPFQAPGDGKYPDSLNWMTTGEKHKFIAMMKNLDDAIGRIMQAIDDASIANNTLIIFTSDNGGDKFSDMGPYRGKKATLWEGGIREPAFVRWPAVIKPGTATEQVAITMDWTATILAAAKAKPDPNYPLDGIDLMPILKGNQKIIPRTFYWRLFQIAKQKAIREDNWKYLQNETGEYLFNLADDPGEKNNLRNANPAKFEALKKKYSAWEKEVLPPVEL